MKTIELFMSTNVLTPIKDGGCERLAGWNRAAVGKKVPGWILEVLGPGSRSLQVLPVLKQTH